MKATRLTTGENSTSDLTGAFPNERSADQRRKIGEMALTQAALLAPQGEVVLHDIEGQNHEALTDDMSIAASTRVAIITNPPSDPQKLREVLENLQQNGATSVLYEPEFTNSAVWLETLTLATVCVLSSPRLAEMTVESDLAMGLYGLSLRGVNGPLLVVISETGIVTALHRGEWLVERPRTSLSKSPQMAQLTQGALLGALAAALSEANEGELLLAAAKKAALSMSMVEAGQSPSSWLAIEEFDAEHPWERLQRTTEGAHSPRWRMVIAIGLILGTTISMALSLGDVLS